MKKTKGSKETLACKMFGHVTLTFVCAEDAIEQQWACSESGNCSRVGAVQELLSQYLSGRFFCKMSLRKHISTSEENIYHLPEYIVDPIWKFKLENSHKRYFVAKLLVCICMALKSSAWCVKSWQLDGRVGRDEKVKLFSSKQNIFVLWSIFYTFSPWIISKNLYHA